MSDRPTKPRSSRGGRSRESLAYDLGRRGEEAPDWLDDDPAHREAYERGVGVLDRAGGASRRGGSRPDLDFDDDDDEVIPGQGSGRPTSETRPAPAAGGSSGQGGRKGGRGHTSTRPTRPAPSSGKPTKPAPAPKSSTRRAVDTMDAVSSDPLWDAGDGGGVVFGVLAWAIGGAYFREGSYGIRRWLSAKFINKVLPKKQGALGSNGAGGGGAVARPASSRTPATTGAVSA